MACVRPAVELGPGDGAAAVTAFKATSDVWWKNAVVYCLDVQTFFDSDGDGCGDFAGLTERVDHLAGLGVTCIWLMPFFPSPERDDGYDIVDFFAIDPKLGTLGDFTEFVRTARDRGMRVIADLVVNHTSHRHPWFQAAREDRSSPYRQFYVWRDEKPDEKPGDVVFPDQESSNWAYDEQAGQWYMHRFYREQPDLNVANPEVRDELAQIAGFWLQQGLSGFRVDAVPFLIEPAGLPDGAIADPHELLRDLRSFLTRRRGEAVLLGEVNLPPDEQRSFFGNDDELHMVFNFTVNQAMYLALARSESAPLERALRRLPAIPEDAQWGNFVRNHDELSLDKLTDAEREEVFAAFGPEPGMQLYGRGIRRRLPSMLGGDERRIRMVYSLMFSLPGTPVLFYGEEIGMVENLDIEGRLSVRSPMRWSAERHAGFTTGDTPCRPLADDQASVARQRRDSDSLLNWMERLIRRRKECPELGWGRCELIDTPDHPTVLTHRSQWGDRAVIAVHNLSGEPVTVRFDVEEDATLVDLFADDERRGRRVELELEPYAHRWYRRRARGERVAL